MKRLKRKSAMTRNMKPGRRPKKGVWINRKHKSTKLRQTTTNYGMSITKNWMITSNRNSTSIF